MAAGEPCLAQTHWARRWPIVAPIALATGIWGEFRTTVALAPFAYTCATLMLMVFIGNRLFGRPSGYIAAVALALTPAYAIQTLQPAADGTELAWLLASFAAALMAYDRKLVAVGPGRRRRAGHCRANPRHEPGDVSDRCRGHCHPVAWAAARDAVDDPGDDQPDPNRRR